MRASAALPPCPRADAGRQRGAALFIGLMMMLVVGVLTLSAASVSRLQERMSGGAQDQSVAFQAAEMALRDAEQYVFATLSSASAFDDACTAGLCLPATGSTPQWDQVDWHGGLPIRLGAMTGEPLLPGLVREPSFIVELLPDLPAGIGNSLSSTLRSSSTGGGTGFRITATAWGRKPGTQVRLQSMYVKQ
ncbi:MAG TPA: PilX N-terminal domain-containing pilus assembly protein [Burkholderiaceae bacterium]|nr:PilX N-terminal domain-containing pilus assembly protein [Burkholderiaceae bacterium]